MKVRTREIVWLQFLPTVLFILFAILAKFVSPNIGWAASDAKVFHIPVINEFIRSGIHFDYKIALAMFPGMHIVFAEIAKLFGITALSPDGWAAFAIQPLFAALYLVGLNYIFSRIRLSPSNRALALLINLGSSYLLYSWLWPVTDLSAFVCYLGATIVIMCERSPSLTSSIAYALLVLGAAFFRQNFVSLSAGPLILLFLNTTPRNWGRAILKNWHVMLPIIVGLAFVAYLYHIWGGLIPPNADQNHLSHHGIVWHSIAHVVALTGLIGWPFAVILATEYYRATGKLDWPNITAAAVVSALCVLLIPMTLNRPAGRWASMVWSMEGMLHSRLLGLLFIAVLLAVGFYIWQFVIRRCLRDKAWPPEIVLFVLNISTYLIQPYAWQRYVEMPILLALSIFIFKRFDVRGTSKIVMFTWFFLFFSLSFSKAVLGLGRQG